MPIRFSDDHEADRLVNENAFAFLVAMLLDQQVPLTWAFNGPNRLVERLGLPFEPARIASVAPDEFAAAAAAKPAIHRYHKTMAARIQAMAQHLVDHHGGSAAALWSDTEDGQLVVDRLSALPGFGAEKVKITVATLAKRFGIQLHGWEVLSEPFSDVHPRSVADIDSPASFARVKAWKKAQKEAGLGKDDPSVSATRAR